MNQDRITCRFSKVPCFKVCRFNLFLFHVKFNVTFTCTTCSIMPPCLSVHLKQTRRQHAKQHYTQIGPTAAIGWNQRQGWVQLQCKYKVEVQNVVNEQPRGACVPRTQDGGSFLCLLLYSWCSAQLKQWSPRASCPKTCCSLSYVKFWENIAKGLHAFCFCLFF